MKINKYFKFVSVALLGFLFACRGQTMKTTPVHVVWNMDEQRRFGPFEKNKFFADNRAMRTPVKGTIHRGGLRFDKGLYQGINEDSSFVEEIPIAVTKKVLLRGQQKYDIYCTPCHGIKGDGKGVIMTGGYGFVPAPSYYIERIRNMPVGEMYSAIANGVRTMFSYANQIDVKDRWAIVAYVQALQKSQHVTGDELALYNITAEKIKEISPVDTSAAKAPTGGVVSADIGEKLINSYGCTTCHSTENTNLYAPSFRDLYGSVVTLSDGSIVEANKGYLVESMQYPAAKIVLGYRVEMPQYRDLMTDAEMYSVVEYLKTLSGEHENGLNETRNTATSDTLEAAVSDTATTVTNDTAQADTSASEKQND